MAKRRLVDQSRSGVLLSVNLAAQTLPTPHDTGRTGIGKHPVTWAVPVSDPGPKRPGHPRPNGLAGDIVCTTGHHGGTDQAVYAYAREDLDWWERELGYELPAGRFGENLTTQGLDLTGTLVGERWRIGGTVVLQGTSPRIPCATFAHRMREPKWVKRFAARGATGTYLRVVVPGEIRAGDRIEVIQRPRHTVTIGQSFRALTTHAELLPGLLEAGDDLPPEERAARPAPHRLTPAAPRPGPQAPHLSAAHRTTADRSSRAHTRRYARPGAGYCRPGPRQTWPICVWSDPQGK